MTTSENTSFFQKNTYMTTENTIYFYTSSQKYNEFSNYYIAKFQINGETYSSVEAYYQSQKFNHPTASVHEKEFASIIAKAKPSIAKYMAQLNIAHTPRYSYLAKLEPTMRKYKELGVKIDPQWEERKLKVMYLAVYCKFSQNEHLKALLLSTGNKILAENSPYDTFWGCRGTNHLGKILMTVRDELRN